MSAPVAVADRVVTDTGTTGRTAPATPADLDSVPSATRWLAGVLDRLRDHDDGLVVAYAGEPGSSPTRPATLAEWTRWGKKVRQLERLGVPTVGAFSGPVDGLAFHLLLTVDLAVIAPDTTIRCDELDRGHLPDMVVFRLAKTVGLGHARRLLFRGRRIDATEALRLGLVADVGHDPVELARSLVAAAPAPGSHAWPLARRLLLESYATSFEDGHGALLAAQDRLLRTPTTTERRPR